MASLDHLFRDRQARRKKRRPMGLSKYEASLYETLEALETQQAWLWDKIMDEHRAGRSALDLLEKWDAIRKDVASYQKSLRRVKT